MKTHDIIYIAMGTALISICSWIIIPTAVPFTLQLFAIFLITTLFGGKRGIITVIVYILLGSIGIPVFSGFTGGIGILLSPLGGFIFGFIAIPLLVRCVEILPLKSKYQVTAAMILGLFICYACGVTFFLLSYHRLGTSISLGKAVSTCVLPFIIPDILKLALALFVGKRLRHHTYIK